MPGWGKKREVVERTYQPGRALERLDLPGGKRGRRNRGFPARRKKEAPKISSITLGKMKEENNRWPISHPVIGHI